MFQVEICSQQLEICKTVCMFIVLAIIVENDSLSVVLFRCLPIITSWRKVWTDDCRSWPREGKINNHGCWGKYAHIPDNDYWGISVACRMNHFFGVQLFLCGTHGIYFYLHPTFFSTEQCASPRKSSNLGSCAYYLHYCTGKQNYLLWNILRFALKICFWVDF